MNWKATKMINQKLAGFALALGAILFMVTNTVLTIRLPSDGRAADIFGSDAFLLRLSFAAATVFFLLVGAMGIARLVAQKPRRLGAAAFAATFVGSLFVFAHEWGQVFFLHELANVAPEGMNALDERQGLNLYSVEPLLGLPLFLIGWILLAISALISPNFRAIGPMILLGGFCLLPLLAYSLPGVWGFVVGNSVLGIGWFLMAFDLMRYEGAHVTPSP